MATFDDLEHIFIIRKALALVQLLSALLSSVFAMQTGYFINR